MGIGIEAVVPDHDLALDAYIRRLVEAGHGKRIMFGSDNMAWPESIRLAVESIESADFLTPE
jgi:predicted TIM-barrel fold metal-dependent hydrolase